MSKENLDGMATAGAAVDSLVDWLKGELIDVGFGEVGLIFTVHGNKIVKYKKVLEVVTKP